MTIKMLMYDFRHSEETFCTNTQNLEGFDIKFFNFGLNKETLENLSAEQFEETEVLNVFITSKLDETVLSRFKNLKLIATRSTGVDHIDIDYCKTHNIEVINVRDYGKTAVAQFTFTLILALVRNLFPAIEGMKKFQPASENLIGKDLASMTLGVVGTGAIGAEVIKIAETFGMKIFAFDPFPKSDLKKYYTSFENLLEVSDIISLHAPLTKENYHMFSTEQFEKMKCGSYLINTSRGELIDTLTLYDALDKKKLHGAALDVIESEDVNFYQKDFLNSLKTLSSANLKQSLVFQRILEMPNVIITPHIAYDTEQAVEFILQTVFKKMNELLLS